MNRKFLTVPLQIKATRDGQFEGHGAVFGNIDLHDDIIIPGAFKKSLREHKDKGSLPQMYWMHQPDQVPGKWIDMREDEKGLAVVGELLPTSLGKDMDILLKAKAVRGLSIGFMTRQADYNADGIRLIKDIDLWEVSLVSLAANPLAEVESVKARLSHDGEFVPRPRDFEKTLRDAGYSKQVAKQITAKVFSGIGNDDPTRDAENEDLKAIKRLLLERVGMERSLESLFE